MAVARDLDGLTKNRLTNPVKAASGDVGPSARCNSASESSPRLCSMRQRRAFVRAVRHAYRPTTPGRRWGGTRRKRKTASLTDTILRIRSQGAQHTLRILSPGVALDHRFTRAFAEPTPQAGVIHQAQDGVAQRLGIVGRDQQRRLAILKHVANLPHAAGDDRSAGSHVLEKFGRRTEKLTAVGLA